MSDKERLLELVAGLVADWSPDWLPDVRHPANLNQPCRMNLAGRPAAGTPYHVNGKVCISFVDVCISFVTRPPRQHDPRISVMILCISFVTHVSLL